MTEPEKNNDKEELLTELNPELNKEEKEVLEKELELSRDKFLRLAADFDNFKKITQREQIISLKFANDSLIQSLLPVMDNLEEAIKAYNKTENTNSKDLVVGINMVLKQLLEVLNKFGVKIFSAVGMQFDPKSHEAISEQINDDIEEGLVVQEYQKGCYLHDRLIRPARVVVSKKSVITEK